VEKLAINLEQGTQFTGYDTLQGQARVVAIYSNGQQVQAINADQEALLILNTSPFYAESGGQVGDKGLISCHRGAAYEAVFEIIDTQKQGEHFIHKGVLRSGTLTEGDEVDASVAADNRAAIALNHSATHLLHAALRKVLGTHVTQKGSLVSAERLRFDFSHQAAVTAAELAQIEAMVNAEIIRNSPVSKQLMGMEQAMNKGAMALFGEKYADEVRVVSMGDFSTELCGGTHVDRTGDIGLFKFVSESGVAAGVRRVEAATGKGALALIERQEAVLKQLCDVVKTNADTLVEKVQQLIISNKALERELEQTRIKLASAGGSDMGSGAQAINGVSVLVKTVEGLNARTLRETVDQLKNKLGTAVVVLACIEDGKVSIVAGVSKDVCERVKAGDLVNMVAAHVGGKGGGRPDMAMAGGPDVDGLPAGLAAVPAWVEAHLQ
jgi:alanyl-tRNA synthetase